MNFKAVFSLAVRHAYQGGRCADVEWVLPADTAARLRGGRLLGREAAGRLYVLAATDEDGAAPSGSPGPVLRFGLRLTSASFPNYTNLPAGLSAVRTLYRNFSAAGALDVPQMIRLVGAKFRHELTDPSHEAAMVIKDGSGAVLRSEVVAANSRTAWSCEVGATRPGLYAVDETSGGNQVSKLYYVDEELSAAGVMAVVEIKINPGFHSMAPEFVVSLEARTETLKYYVVAAKYTDADCASLAITDAGFGADGRPAIEFDRVEAEAFTAAEIAPGLIGAPAAKVVLFRSRAPVARTAGGRTGIQLKRGGEILAANLPQPAPDNACANIIVSVAKP